MSKDFRVYLEDILLAVERIESYLSGIDYDQFAAEQMRIDAVVRNLGIIGEAVRKIPPEIHVKYPRVEWQKINSFRNVIVHEYSRVKLEVVWSVLEEDLPTLKTQIAEILKIEDDSNPA
ncbi:MAG: DUF86 domain-containing protein [Anaerolineae bacterium]